MEHKLFVKNLVQKVIFLSEMQGQISDGMWENSGPRDHWMDWGKLNYQTVITTNDQDMIGRNFHAVKDNYNLNSKELLDIVGDRLLFYSQFAYEFPDQAAQLLAYSDFLPDSVEEFTKYYEQGKAGETSKYEYENKRIKLTYALGITPEMLANAIKTTKFQIFQLRTEIAGLRKAMKANWKGDPNAESPLPINPLGEVEPEPEEATSKEIAEAIKEVVAITTADAKSIVIMNFSGGEVIWDGFGWYQYNRRNAMWSKLETIDHSNTSPIVFIESADLIDVDEE